MKKGPLCRKSFLTYVQHITTHNDGSKINFEVVNNGHPEAKFKVYKLYASSQESHSLH